MDAIQTPQQKKLYEHLKNIPPEKRAFRNFASYIALSYPDYRFSRHNLLIANALMQVEAGNIRRLIVTMPPRHGKTMQISEYFPPWYLGRNPSHQIIATTYSFERAGDVGRKVRNHMIDPMHHKIFPGCTLSLDSKSANKLATDQDGNYYSVGVGGAVIGRGANIFLIDDPVKSRQEAESETSRRKIWEWYRGVAYTRLMPQNAIIVVMTRWHFDDLVGRLLDEMAHENWVVLNLPAICDSEDDLLKREIGEALWPTDYPLGVLENIQVTIGTREWNSQYQQQPLPTEGGLINIDWFQKYNHLELVTMARSLGHSKPYVPFGIKKFVISWDTAFKEEQLNDPSAATVWGESADNNFYLIEVVNKRMKYPALKKAAVELYEKYMGYKLGQVPVLIEDKASGQSLIQDLKHETRMPVIARPADANKQIRLSSASPLIEAGRVYLPDQAPWLVGYETQLARFPLWKNDDMVDSTSQFLNWAGKPRFKKGLRKRFWK